MKSCDTNKKTIYIWVWLFPGEMKSRTYIAFLWLAPLLQVTGFFLDVTFVVFKVHEVLSTKYKQCIYIYIWREPSKHARSDPEVFRLQPVVAVTANVQPKSGLIVHAISDFLHPFQFHFSKEGMDRIVQNRPGSDLDGLVRVSPDASGLEASRCVGIIWPGVWRDTTSLLPVSDFQTQFRSSTDVSDNVVQN